MKYISMLFVLGLIALSGCTENARAKSFGGTATENLAAGHKLINVTWKEGNLWVLTRPMREGEVAETYEFAEKSSFGMIQGKVLLKESK